MKKDNTRVDVNKEEVTPISKEKIEHVNAHTWSDIKMSDLHHQKTILENRLFYAQQIGNIALIEQLNKGIQHINNIIQQRSIDKTDLLF